VTERPFRFGLQVFNATSRSEWQDQARQAEDLGLDTILVPDHVLTGVFAPIVALDAMASVTSRLRVGTFVLNNDFRHPALVARDAATLDLLTDGRFELGIGAGHAAPEYAELGLDFDHAARRVDRLEESVQILRRLFDGQSVTVDGEHYQLRDHQLFPQRRPALLVGGNGTRVLELAAREADIVGFTGLGRTRADGQHHDVEWRVDQIDAKVRRVRVEAGERFDSLELNALVQQIEITDDRSSVIEATAHRVGADVDVMLAAPYMLIGTVDEVVEQIHDARTRWGLSYFVTRAIEPTAQIIAALRS
jgi:probable F420-dependent oxidoreductase